MTSSTKQFVTFYGLYTFFQGVIVYAFGWYVKYRFQASAVAFMEWYYKLTEGFLRHDLAMQIADGQTWIAIGGYTAISGLTLFMLGLCSEASPTPPKGVR